MKCQLFYLSIMINAILLLMGDIYDLQVLTITFRFEFTFTG